MQERLTVSLQCFNVNRSVYALLLVNIIGVQLTTTLNKQPEVTILSSSSLLSENVDGLLFLLLKCFEKWQFYLNYFM